MHAAVVPAAQVGARTVGPGGSRVLPQSGQGGVIVVTSLPRDTASRSHAKQGTTTIGLSIMNKVPDSAIMTKLNLNGLALRVCAYHHISTRPHMGVM